MSTQQLPKDGAQIVLWFHQLPQPTAFLTTRDEAERAMQTYERYMTPSYYPGPETAAEAPQPEPNTLSFLSYPGGHGVRSRSSFSLGSLRGVTIEYPTIQLAD